MSNALKTGKKIFTMAVVVTTIVWSIGVFAIPVTFAATSGDLIKIKCTGSNASTCTAVYYLGANGKRYVFPNEKTYKTWYADFSSVKDLQQSEMESYPIGGNVTSRPGVKMVKITTDPKVYAIAKGGTLRWVMSEAVAKALYGDMWNKQIDDVSDAFFVNYTLGADISSSSSYDKAAEMAAATSINTDKGLTTGPTTGGSTLTVALASDTPASGLVMGSAARVPFTTVTLTASSDGDITVDSITILRGSIAQDGAFSSFDLLDAATMLPLNSLSKSLNSDHTAIFGDDIIVSAGTTKKVILAANMTSGALSSYAGEIPTLGVTAIVLKGGATLVGTLPITGNYQTVNGTLTVGTAAITVGSNNPAAATKEVGTKDYIVSSIKISNNSTATNQDFRIKSVTFTQNGSASPEDIESVKLVNTNTSEVLGTVAAPSSKKVSFTGIDLLVKKGDTLNLDLRLNIRSGSARTISLDVDQQSDVVIYDTLRSYNVLPSYTNSSATTVSASPYYDAPNTTIGNGKLRVESLTVTPNRVSKNAKKVVLGKFKFVVEGEALNVTSLGFKLTTTTGTTGYGLVTNIIMKDASGASLTSPKDPTLNTNSVGALTSESTATSTDTVTMPVGENTYTVYGDLDNNFVANDTVQLGIFPEAITVRGDVSGNLITPTPSGQVQSTSLTVKAATLAISLGTLPAAQTIVKGAQNLEVARYILDASNSGQDIRITQIAVNVYDTDAAPNILTGIELFDGANKIVVGSSSQSCSGATCSTTNTRATTTMTIAAGDLVVAKGTTKVLTVVGDVSTSNSTGSFNVHLGGQTFSGIDEEGQTITPTVTDGNAAAMTLTSAGTLQIANSTDPKAALVVGGTTVEVARFVAKAKNDGMTLQQFGILITDNNEGIDGTYENINTLELWEQGGSAALGTIPVNAAQVTIVPGTAISMALDAEKTYLIKAKFTALTANSAAAAKSGEGIAVKLTNVDVTGNSVGSGTVSLSGHNSAFKSFSEFKSVPTYTVSSFTGSNKITGNTTVDLFKFNVKADSAGPIALAKFTFGITTSVVTLSTSGFYMYESGDGNTYNQLSGTGDFVVTVTTSLGTLAEARFDVNNDDTVARDSAGETDAYLIDAGVTKYFKLVGTVSSGHNSTAADEHVTTVMAGDAGFAATSQTNVSGIDTAVHHDDFIWSDLNFDLYSSSSNTAALGWFNGYRVTGLDNASTTQQDVDG